MILHVMSDLHLDFMRPSERQSFYGRLRSRYDGEPEVLVLAGDIASLRPPYTGVLTEALQVFEELYPVVLYVPGNHEFWGTSVIDGRQRLRAIRTQFPKLQILQVGTRHQHLGGLVFGGDVLWFPDSDDDLMKRYWPDYQYIRDPEEFHGEHLNFRDQKDLPEVVVTHHFPTAESIAPEYRGAPTNIFFHSQLEDWLQQARDTGTPAVGTRLWIHGHTHNPMDFQSAFGFRVYCNPLGYRDEGKNPGFWDRIRVDTEAQP